MREREARRNVVDDATQLITDTVELTSNNIADIMALQDRLLELEQAAGDDEVEAAGKQIPPAQMEVMNSADPASSIVRQGLAMHFRLRIRFDDDHPVVTSFAVWHDANEEVVR